MHGHLLPNQLRIEASEGGGALLRSVGVPMHGLFRPMHVVRVSSEVRVSAHTEDVRHMHERIVLRPDERVCRRRRVLRVSSQRRQGFVVRGEQSAERACVVRVRALRE